MYFITLLRFDQIIDCLKKNITEPKVLNGSVYFQIIKMSLVVSQTSNRTRELEQGFFTKTYTLFRTTRIWF